MKSRVNTLNRLVAALRERVPRGQKLTEKFPVLDLGVRLAFHEKRRRFTVDGEVEEPLHVDWQGFVDLAPKWQQTSDFHCVTKWSRLDLVWSGISFSQIIAIVRSTDAAGFVVAHGADGYSTNLGLEDVMADDVLLAFELGGKPLRWSTEARCACWWRNATPGSRPNSCGGSSFSPRIHPVTGNSAAITTAAIPGRKNVMGEGQ